MPFFVKSCSIQSNNLNISFSFFFCIEMLPSTMSNSRSTYHSDFKFAVSCGFVKPDSLKIIPKSTLYGFKQYNYDSLVGNDYSAIISQISLLKEIAASREALAVAHAVLRILHLCSSFNIPFSKLSRIKSSANKKKVIDRKSVV